MVMAKTQDKGRVGKAVLYRGKRLPNGEVSVKVESYPPTHITNLSLARSLKVINHSPTGFEWGYGGSGPAQLALAILLDFTGDKERALAHYQDFKWAFVCKFSREPNGEWVLTGDQIRDWLAYEERGEQDTGRIP